ncbi:hypothetical protein LRS10_23620 [Phenylobacterium sp. J426]|uniref:hypothetical protein n=1 Tax=Phenylobacterium sp. J426 TaxID=2898439 RepID=UPI002150C18D|nr:hypothetical protein [Phenylobacterium sp. J426]MCR5876881.1 hypothetical protein [Phenylobacterium sp. J426]
MTTHFPNIEADISRAEDPPIGQIEDLSPELFEAVSQLLDEVVAQPPYSGGAAPDADAEDELPIRIDVEPMDYTADASRRGWLITAIDERTRQIVGFSLFFPEEQAQGEGAP